MKQLITIISLLAFGHLLAQDSTTSFSLDAVQKYALEHNYNIMNANLDVKSAKKKVNETTTIGLPQVSADVKFQNFIDIPTQVLSANFFNPKAPADQLIPIQFGTNYNTTASLSASQLIFSGSYIVGLQAAKTYKMLSTQSLKKTQIDITNAVAQAYFTVLLAKENTRILDSTLNTTQTIFNQTQQIYKQGLMQKQDVDQLQLNLNSLVNMYDDAKRQLRLSYQMLKLQIGMDISTKITLTDNLKDILDKEQKTSILNEKFSPENNITYGLLDTQRKLAKLNLSRERVGYLPTISAFYTFQEQALQNKFDLFADNTWYKMSLWGIGISIPIFDSGNKMAKTSQAHIALDKIETQQKHLAQSLTVQFQSAESNYLSAKSQLKSKKDNLFLAKDIYGTTLKKYNQGVSSSLDLSQTQNQYLRAQGNYINAIYTLLNAKNKLNKLLSK